MSSKTYKARVLVLRKTKLGDKDLIVTMLDEQGELVQGVAKGARKPGGSFAARLEVFCEADVLMAKGRSLDVVCEARLVNPGKSIAWELDKSSCAAPIAELLCHVAQPELPQPRVFDMSRVAFACLHDDCANLDKGVAVCAAGLWKIMSQIGFRPSFSTCVSCGAKMDLSGDGAEVPLSVADGGATCESCRRPADALLVESRVLQWCDALIMMRFQDIVASEVDVSTSMDVLHLARLWVRAHTGRDLKSLDFLLTTGLFDGGA